MMRKTTNILLTLAVLLCMGCGSKNIIDEERTFANDVWNRFTPEVFEVSVNNTDDYYNIDVTVAADTTVFRYSLLPTPSTFTRPQANAACSTPRCLSRRMGAGRAR